MFIEATLFLSQRKTTILSLLAGNKLSSVCRTDLERELSSLQEELGIMSVEAVECQNTLMAALDAQDLDAYERAELLRVLQDELIELEFEAMTWRGAQVTKLAERSALLQLQTAQSSVRADDANALSSSQQIGVLAEQVVRRCRASAEEIASVLSYDSRVAIKLGLQSVAEAYRQKQGHGRAAICAWRMSNAIYDRDDAEIFEGACTFKMEETKEMEEVLKAINDSSNGLGWKQRQLQERLHEELECLGVLAVEGAGRASKIMKDQLSQNESASTTSVLLGSLSSLAALHKARQVEEVECLLDRRLRRLAYYGLNTEDDEEREFDWLPTRSELKAQLSSLVVERGKFSLEAAIRKVQMLEDLEGSLTHIKGNSDKKQAVMRDLASANEHIAHLSALAAVYQSDCIKKGEVEDANDARLLLCGRGRG